MDRDARAIGLRITGAPPLIVDRELVEYKYRRRLSQRLGLIIAQIEPVRQTQSGDLVARARLHARPEDLAFKADPARHWFLVATRDIDVITLREDRPLDLAYAAGDACSGTRRFTGELA